jgi:NhaA family Na+:H+ antiporter
MAVPALIYAAFNRGLPSAHGWGIPMATDIAFSLGVLALIKGVPPELKVFLLTLAIADDIGAIAVIAIFYTSTLHWNYLLLAVLLIGVILFCRKIGFGRQIFYAILGFGVWLTVLHSGVHATIAGVVLGLLMPVTSSVSLEEFSELGAETMDEFRDAQAKGDVVRANRMLGDMEYLLQRTEPPAERVTRRLNDWISFLVLPLFAIANAGVTFSTRNWIPILHSPIAWGVFLGLLLGKPIGIFAACWLTVKLRLTRLPGSVTWAQIACTGLLAGIGFTVSLFIGGLAFGNTAQLDTAKTAVLLSSLLAGIAGFIVLRRAISSPTPQPKG